MVLDFGIARQVMDEVIDRYDHQYLNEIEPFGELRPTAENVARVVYDSLLDQAEDGGHTVRLESVTVWESPETWASYGGE